MTDAVIRPGLLSDSEAPHDYRRKAAGLNVCGLLTNQRPQPSPTGLDKLDETSSFRFDLGGGTFDVTV